MTGPLECVVNVPERSRDKYGWDPALERRLSRDQGIDIVDESRARFRAQGRHRAMSRAD